LFPAAFLFATQHKVVLLNTVPSTAAVLELADLSTIPAVSL